MVKYIKWEPMNDLPEEEKKEIDDYMESLHGKRLYENTQELEDVLEYVLRHFMGMVRNPIYIYDLDLFNAYLDENLTQDECDSRFYYRTDIERYKENGKRNINFNRNYWVSL